MAKNESKKSRTGSPSWTQSKNSDSNNTTPSATDNEYRVKEYLLLRMWKHVCTATRNMKNRGNMASTNENDNFLATEFQGMK